MGWLRDMHAESLASRLGHGRLGLLSFGEEGTVFLGTFHGDILDLGLADRLVARGLGSGRIIYGFGRAVGQKTGVVVAVLGRKMGAENAHDQGWEEITGRGVQRHAHEA